jgi:hypothetical protein
MPNAHECMSTDTPTPNLYEQVLAKVQDRRDSHAQRLAEQIARIERKQLQNRDGDR